MAVYHREKRHVGVLRMSQQPYLEIDSCALDTLDSLISSWTFPSCCTFALIRRFSSVVPAHREAQAGREVIDPQATHRVPFTMFSLLFRRY